jgi:hypothetical protein
MTTFTHYRGEVLQKLSRKRLIEIAHELIWESERRRQALAAIAKEQSALTTTGQTATAAVDLFQRIARESLTE